MPKKVAKKDEGAKKGGAKTKKKVNRKKNPPHVNKYADRIGVLKKKSRNPELLAQKKALKEERERKVREKEAIESVNKKPRGLFSW